MGPAKVPLWTIPYERNPLFTGREDILNRLSTALRSGKTTALTQPQAISGLGGIGKTQTAVEYAYQYRDDYDAMLWVRAESRETLTSDFVTLAHVLNLPEQQEQEQQRVIEAVKRWFHEHTGWLLIFDNADDLTIVRDFLPPGGKGHLLLTTRSQVTGRIAQRIELEQMEPEEGVLFLLHRATILDLNAPLEAASSSDRDQAEELVQAMAGLPLALDQAGAYIDETRCGLSGYLQLYRTRQADLLKHRGKYVTDHEESVATTWSLSFEKVQQANPAAADLLRLSAFLDPDAISEEIITKGAPHLGPTLQPVAADPIKLNEAIRELLTYSLIRRNPDQTLTIHRLVQAELKHGMNKNTQRRWAERVVRAVSAAFPAVDYGNWLNCQQYMPQVQSCSALIQQWDITFPEATYLLAQAGRYLRDSAQYEQAEPLLQQALAIDEQVLGPEHSDLCTDLNNLALLYSDQGKYELAAPLYQRAIAIDEKALGPQHSNLARDLNNLAELYREQGQYELAVPLYQRALVIRERVFGSTHSFTERIRERYTTLLEQMKQKKNRGQRQHKA